MKYNKIDIDGMQQKISMLLTQTDYLKKMNQRLKSKSNSL